jgi:uncharacterized heparinase superfamily protein
MPAMKLARLIRTVAPLRARQVVGQIRMRLKRTHLVLRIEPTAPAFSGVKWDCLFPFLPPGSAQNSAVDILRGRIFFLNEVHDVGWPPNWRGPGTSKLWLYNLHYFEYIWALPYAKGREVVADWIANSNNDRRNAGRDPYPTSLRLQNWTTYFFGEHLGETLEDEKFCAVLWPSIWRQAQWLMRNLEFHLMANHLWENAVALALTGACFASPSAKRWMDRGMKLLAEQINEQILPDGGHFERSPMYHLRAAYTLALLLNTNNDDLTRLASKPLASMISALVAMCHPDGEIALFNDAAMRVHCRPKNLFGFVSKFHSNDFPPTRGAPDSAVRGEQCVTAEHISEQAGPIALPATGYFGWRHPSGPTGHFVLCDAGDVGPDYQPGHAHGDIFSFELSLNGHRVVTDSGVLAYTDSDARAYCRSTAAHNTVEVSAADQCEFWGVFRVGRRAKPHDVIFTDDGDGFRLQGWHDGYRFLPGSPMHHREFAWKEYGVLLIRDTVSGDKPVSCVGRLHLDKACNPIQISPLTIKVAYPGGDFYVAAAGPRLSPIRITTSYCYPEMGLSQKRPCIEYQWNSREPVTTVISIQPNHSVSMTSGEDIGGRTGA